MLKEADTLVAAGFRVHVVAGRNFAPVDPLDADVIANARWTHTRVEGGEGVNAAAHRLLRRVARLLVKGTATPPTWLAARAHHGDTLRLAAAAARCRSDYYVGHCLAGLPAAAFAARHSGGRYGFDAEDYHDAETMTAIADPVEQRIRRTLHARLLPGAAHITAASPLIAEAYARTYGIKAPDTVLNVFPLHQAPVAPVPPAPVSPVRPARCYWFSQTIGPGRGLEAMVAIAGRMKTPVELHLRGHSSAAYRSQLQQRATASGFLRPLVFHASGPAGEMVRLAAAFDLGLSIEESQPLNRDLCLTNKIFVYLLAGIPQFLSNTRAQTAFAPALGDAALTGALSAVEASAGQLDAFFASPARIRAAREAAWRLARSPFCWEHESAKFLSALERGWQ